LIGFIPAKHNLAMLYMEGLALPQDLSTARVLLSEILAATEPKVESIGSPTPKADNPFRKQALLLLSELDTKYAKKGF